MSINPRPHPESPAINTATPAKLVWRPLFFGIVTFLLLALLMAMLVYQRYRIESEQRDAATLSYVTDINKKLDDAVDKCATAIETLSFFVQPDGTVANFDSIAAQLHARQYADVLQLVPGGVIRHVYPRKGNEVVLGYDILHDSTRNKEALRSISAQEPFFAGPLKLRQGGVGIVGRMPIHRQGKFWGFSAGVLRLENLLRSAGIDSSSESGYHLELSKFNLDTQQEEVFLHKQKQPAADGTISIQNQSGDWKISARPLDDDAYFADLYWLGLLGLVLSVLGGAFVASAIRRPARLDQLVKERTAALAASEQNYRSLIEQASEAIIVYDKGGRILQFNEPAHTQAGYTREEFAVLNIKELLVEPTLEFHHDSAAAIDGKKTAMLERLLRRKDGVEQEIEVNVTLIRNNSMLAFVRNITERKAAERALRASEQKFASVFQSDLIGLMITNDDGIIVDANDYYARMLDTTPDQLVGRKTTDVGFVTRLPPDKRNEYLEDVTRLLQDEQRVTNYEIPFETPGKPTRYILLSVIPTELNGRRHMFVTTLDISQEKYNSLLLQQSELKYRSLFEQASAGIIITDLLGNILEVNESTTHITGFEREELTGRPIVDFLPADDLIEHPLRFEELKAGKSLMYERKARRKDGAIIDIEINSKLASHDTLIGFIRDITERKIAEEKLRISNDRFETISQATTDAIWNYDFATNSTVGNDNFYAMYGLNKNKDSISLEDFITRVHPDEQEGIRANFFHALSNQNNLITEEFRFRTPDGAYRNIFDRAFIKYEANGRPSKIIGVMQDVTDRRNYEQQLLKEKELSDSIINSLPAVFYLYNQQGKFLRWNRNFELVTGYSEADMETLHPLDLFDEREKNLLQEKIGNVFLNGEDYVEANFRTKHGRFIPYYFSGMKINYEGEICLMGFGLDFTDKMAAQQAINDSEQKFRSLVEQASDGVSILHPSSKSIYVSPAVQRITGYSEEELVSANWMELVHPDDVGTLRRLFKRSLQEPGLPLKNNIVRVLHKDGGWRWLEKTITGMQHIPAINGIVVNFRDVTEKLEIEQHIFAEKELSDSIINNLPGIFYLYDHRGKFLRWNKNFEAVSGYTAEDIRHLHPVDFYDEPEKTFVRQRMLDVLKKKMPPVELLLFTRDKKKIPYYYNVLAIEYEGIPCVLGMAFDVTDRKAIEQELLVSNRNLEQKAGELKASYAELERFAYIVSHDLQEPLRMVSSFLKLLEKKYKGSFDETGEKYIHFAVDGAERMKHLIMDLLEYSRTGTSKDVAADTDMNQVMNDVSKVLKNSIEESGAMIYAENLPVLAKTSKLQMFQLLQNLVGNALKYHGSEPPVIRISAQATDTHWLFAVQDNGIGIDPQFSEKIFIIFQRLHSKNEFSGSGIGLSICKKIVEKHGGKIWVDQAPGGGSIFYFTIAKN